MMGPRHRQPRPDSVAEDCRRGGFFTHRHFTEPGRVATLVRRLA